MPNKKNKNKVENNNNIEETKKFPKLSISWDNGIYGNSAESIDFIAFFKNIILHILSNFNKNNVVIEIISNI